VAVCTAIPHSCWQPKPLERQKACLREIATAVSVEAVDGRIVWFIPSASSPNRLPGKDSNSSRTGFSTVDTILMEWMILQEGDFSFSKSSWPERGLLKTIANEVMRFAQLGVRGSGTNVVCIARNRQAYWAGRKNSHCVQQEGKTRTRG
jgi:hypothetical protein